MPPRTLLVAAIVVLAAAVAFLLWERSDGLQTNPASDSTIDGRRMGSASDAASLPAAVVAGGVDPGASISSAQSTGPFDAVLASPAPPSGSPGALERSVLDFQNKALTPHASKLADSLKFDEYAAKLQADADADAVKRMREYHDLFDETLAALPGGQSVDRLACGVKMCMASIVADKKWPDFSNWQMSLHELSDLPMQASVVGLVDRPDGGVAYQLIFTTSREFNAIRGGPSQP